MSLFDSSKANLVSVVSLELKTKNFEIHLWISREVLKIPVVSKESNPERIDRKMEIVLSDIDDSNLSSK